MTTDEKLNELIRLQQETNKEIQRINEGLVSQNQVLRELVDYIQELPIIIMRQEK